MPLARIVTSTPDQVASLSQWLRSRGYTVELVCPGALRSVPAERRLGLQARSSEELLGRGTNASEGANSGRRAVAYDITGRPVEFAEGETEAIADSSAFAEARQGIRSARLEMVENLRLSFAHLRELLAGGKRSLHEYRTRYQQLRAQATAQAEERRRARRRQSPPSLLVKPGIPPQPHRYRRNGDWQVSCLKGLLAVNLLALLATVGLAASRNWLPATPLSNRDSLRSRDLSQPIPFGAAPAPRQPSANQPAAVNVSGREPCQEVSVPQTELAVVPTAVRPAVRKRPVHRAHDVEGEFIADDKVIIYRRRPGGTSNRGTEPKRISDTSDP